MMVRSRSLNSPLMASARACPEAGPSAHAQQARRHRSGEGAQGDAYASDPTVSVEQCSARLNMRQALFGLRSTSSERGEDPSGALSLFECHEPTLVVRRGTTSRANEEGGESSTPTPKTMIWTAIEANKRQVKKERGSS